MAQFAIGSDSQPYNLLGRQYHQHNRTGAASPMLSQPLNATQRSIAGLQHKGSSGCSLQQHSNFSQLGPVSQQQAYSSRPMSGFSLPAAQPALSGVFRPGSAPQASQLDVLSASQWSKPAGGLGPGLSPRNELAGHANSGLLRPKPVSLLRGPGGNSNSIPGQVQNRPGSAPGLLSVGAQPPNIHQHRSAASLLGPAQRNLQHTPMHQQHGPSGLGLANSGSQQQRLQGMVISGSQQKYEQYGLEHGPQGLGAGLELESTGGTESASAAALPESLPLQQQMAPGNQQHLLQLLPLGGKSAASGKMRDGSRTAGMVQGGGGRAQQQQCGTGALPEAVPAEACGEAAPAVQSASAEAAASDKGATKAAAEAAAVEQANAAAAAAAAVAAANVDLVKRISSLEECCNCMNSIVKRDIPSLLQQHATTQDKLQAMADTTNSKHRALEARMEVVVSSFASFMDGLRTWQQEQQQLQQEREAERLHLQLQQQLTAGDQSTVACQTTPGVLGSNLGDAAADGAAAAAAGALQPAVNKAPDTHQAAVTSPAASRYNRHEVKPGLPVLLCGNGDLAGSHADKMAENIHRQHAEGPFGGYAGLTGIVSLSTAPAVIPAAGDAAKSPAEEADTAAAEVSAQAHPSGGSNDAAKARPLTKRAAARKGGSAAGRKKAPAASKRAGACSKQADGLVQSKLAFSGCPVTRRAAAAAEQAEVTAEQKTPPVVSEPWRDGSAASAGKESDGYEFAAGVRVSPIKACTMAAVSLPGGTAGRHSAAAVTVAANTTRTTTAAEVATERTTWFTKRSSSRLPKHSGSTEQLAKQQSKEVPAKPNMTDREGFSSGSCLSKITGAAAGSGVSRHASIGQQQQTHQLLEAHQQQQTAAQRQFQRRSGSNIAAVAQVHLLPAPSKGRKGGGAAVAAAAASEVSAFAAAAVGMPNAGVLPSRIGMMKASETGWPTLSTVSTFAAAHPTTSVAAGASFSRRGTAAASTPTGSMLNTGGRPGAAGMKRSRSLVSAPPVPVAQPRRTAVVLPSTRPVSRSALMLFGEMDSDSLDGVTESHETAAYADQNTAPTSALFGNTMAPAGGNSTAYGSAHGSMHGCSGAKVGTSAAAATAQQYAGATAAAVQTHARPGAQSGSATAVSSRQAARTTTPPASMLVDDDELAQQVAARMARHRNKRLRCMRSSSQMV